MIIDDNQAVKYINDSRAGNISEEVIRQNLIAVGWDPAAIDNAFKQASLASASPRSVRQPKSRPLLFLGVFLLLITLGAGIFLFLNRPGQPEPVPAASNPEDFALTTADIKTILTDTLSTDMAFTAETTVVYQSCSQTVSYNGAVVAGNWYAKQQSSSPDPAVSPECSVAGATDIYLENYQIGTDIYGRQYADKNYEKYTDSARLRATAPGEFITSLIGDFKTAGFSPVQATGSIFTSEYQITDSTRSGRVSVSVNVENRKLIQIDYSFSYPDQPATSSGRITFSDPPDVIRLPDLAPPADDFLLNTMTDISNDTGAEFMVNTATFSIDSHVDVMPLIHVLSGEQTTAKAADCYLSKKECMEKLLTLRGYVSSVIDIVKTARPVACEPELPQTGFPSEIYKDKIRIRVTNEGRNPRESFDFSSTVDFMLGGDNQNTYTVRLRSGREYCYTGDFDPRIVTQLVQDLTSYSQSLLSGN